MRLRKFSQGDERQTAPWHALKNVLVFDIVNMRCRLMLEQGKYCAVQKVKPHQEFDAPTLWQWKIVSNWHPPLSWTVKTGTRTRAMLINKSEETSGSPLLPFALHGPSRNNRSDAGAPDGRHLHAFYLSEDLDNDGRIDHITVYAEGGLGDNSLELLASCDLLTIGKRKLKLLPVRVGHPEQFKARSWISQTPFYTKRHTRRSATATERKNETAIVQLRRNIELRRCKDHSPLPQVSINAIMAPAGQDALDFETGDRWKARNNALISCGWFRITFGQPICGPLAFGMDEHFGMGRFVSDID